MKIKLVEYLESELLKINSNDCAFSINTNINKLFSKYKQFTLSIILNSYDNEKLLIDTFYNALYNFYLLNAINIQSLKFAIDVSRDSDCTEIIFSIIDEINF